MQVNSRAVTTSAPKVILLVLHWVRFLIIKNILWLIVDYDTNKLIRYVLATDTPIEKQKWCSGVQTVLNELRIWDATLPEPLVDHLDDY